VKAYNMTCANQLVSLLTEMVRSPTRSLGKASVRLCRQSALTVDG
jgi:hypothetical protein